MKKIVLLVVIAMSLVGCSVLIAGSKDTRPLKKEEIDQIKTRGEFEQVVARSIVDERSIGEWNLVTYNKWYDRGAKVRMLSYVGLDILTLGAWELIGTIGEANTNPSSYYDLKVLYNEKDEIIKIDIIEENRDERYSKKD